MRHAQLVIAASVAATIAVGCSESENPSNPSKDPTLAAAASIPCIGIPNATATWPGDPTAYTNRRVFLESQGWWGERTNGTVPEYGDAEHIHVGMCFPLQTQVSGRKPFRVRVQGHRLPVNSMIQSTLLHDPDGGTYLKINWNRKVLASDNGNVDLWRDVEVNTALFNDGITKGKNGIREFRNLTVVVRPPETGQTVGAELHASSGWCWTISNSDGGNPVNSGTCATTTGAKTTMGRGWYDCFEYKIGEVKNWTYPWQGILPNVAYSLPISGRDGGGDNNTITGWVVRLDPNFHNDDVGFRVDSGGGAANGVSVTIPANRVTTGIRRLVVIGFANGMCSTATAEGIIPQNGQVSGVMAIPIKVN